MLPNDAGGLFLSGHFKWVFFGSILVIEEQLVTRIEMQLDSWVLSFSVRFINSPSMVWQSINQKVISFFSLSKKRKHKSDRLNCTRCLILWLFSGRNVAQDFFPPVLWRTLKSFAFFHASAGLKRFCVIKFNNDDCYDTF